jgi:hypothetical protein
MITKNKKHPELDVELKRRVKAASKTGKLDVSTTPNCQFQFKYVPSLVYSSFGVKKDEVINASETKTGTAAVAANNNNTNKTSSSNVADLRELWLSNNKITVLTRELYSLPKLQVLCLSDNHLKTVPSSIGTIVTLERLLLNGNKITSIPADIMKLKKLKELRLDKNNLTEFPLCLTELKKLVRLGLSYNKIGPSIPSQIHKLKHLAELDLDHNEITDLPKTLVNLNPCLQLLGLSYNRLKSPLPDVIHQLSNLDILRLEGNRVYITTNDETKAEETHYDIPIRHDGYAELRTGHVVDDQHVVHKLRGYLEESFIYNRMNANWLRNDVKKDNEEIVNEVHMLKMRALRKPPRIKGEDSKIKGSNGSGEKEEEGKLKLQKEQSMKEVQSMMKQKISTFRK